MLEVGYQYGWLFGPVYLGADAMFTVFIPDTFESNQIHLSGNTVIPSGLTALIPIIHIYFGYSFKNDVLFTIGTAYGWGLITTLGTRVSRIGFVEIRALIWLDRLLSSDHQLGLHNGYLTIGGGIKL